MRVILLSMVTLLIIITSCGKNDVYCDNAQLCVKNIGNDTIYYAWGSSYHDDTLLPGDKACTYCGEVEITNTYTDVQWVDFDSSKGTYRLLVDDCYVEAEVD